ncbi:flagellar basal body P-ring formation protein FlgA [bacterium]|nr:flagellar basal body P-ring formation protein FlgA [bacterium]
MTRRIAAALLLLACPAARADDPLVVDLPAQAAARTSLVTVGDVARVTGGTPAERARVAALDLAEVKSRDAGVTLTKRAIEFRLKLAGATAAVTGAERTAVAVDRRPVAPDEVVPAAREELLRKLPPSMAGATAELVAPVVVRLPEIPAAEKLVVVARPHAPVMRPGRVQMDVTLSAGGEQLLAFAVQFDVQPGAPQPPAALPPVPGATPPATAPPPAPTGPPVVRARQRVTMTARVGALVVTAAGESHQDGRVGEVIRVENVDSRKVLRARVTGPGRVDIELGETP